MANDKWEPKVLGSLKELQEEGPIVKMDLDEDAWSYGAPPKHGYYDFKLFPGKDTFVVNKVDAEDPKSETYITCNIEAKLISEDKEIDGTVGFPKVTTRVGRGKNISTMAGLMVKLGYKETLQKYAQKQGGLTPKLLCQLIEAALKKEPILKGEWDWRGSYKTTDKKGDDKWVNKYNTYNDFPDDGEGGKLHIVSFSDKTGETYELRAQGQIVRWFGKGEELPELKKGKGLSVGLAPAGPKLVMATDIPTLEVEKPKGSPAPTTPASTDDEALLLE